MKLRRSGRLAGLVMVGAVAPALAFGAGADKLIVPGKSIGPAQLDMTETQAAATLGPSGAKYHVSDGYLYVFGDLQLFVGPDGHVVRIETDSADYRTRDGVGVGSAEPEIATKLGKPALAEDMKQRNDNILMTVGRRLCYEPGLAFIVEFIPMQPHAATRVVLRKDGCARAFGNS